MKLSNKEIQSFLQQIGINCLEKPTLEYLDLIILKVSENIPWQNISMLNQGLGKVPSLEDVKTKMLAGIGGICLDINRFLFYFLKALNFDVQYILCGREGAERKHIALIVHIEKEPFFVDCGDTQAYFAALSLHSKTPLKREIYQYKIEHQGGDLYKNFIKIQNEDWKLLYVFSLQSFLEEELAQMIERYYQDPDYSIFWKDVYFAIYQNKKIVYAKGGACFYQDDKSNLRKIKNASFTEIKKMLYANVDNKILNKLDFVQAFLNLKN